VEVQTRLKQVQVVRQGHDVQAVISLLEAMYEESRDRLLDVGPDDFLAARAEVAAIKRIIDMIMKPSMAELTTRKE
jgi:hypothetical protein